MKIAEIHKIFIQSSGICTDTRTLANKSLYLALKGANFDGNKFVGQALKQGAIFAISDDPSNKKIPNCIIVENSLLCLQELARFHRKTLDIPVIGITGTNGKTTSKELINVVLSTRYHVCSTKGNLNNHIGVPLTILSIAKTHEIAIIEMGANHPGEIADLCKIALPTFGLITNIGKAHLEGFGSFENIIATKTALFKSVKSAKGTIFVNADDPILTKHAKSIQKKTYGTTFSDLQYSILSNGFSVGITSNEGSILSNLFGEYNALNIAATCLIGKTFSIPFSQIAKAIELYEPQNNRSQTIKTEKNTLLLDAYNANPSSMEASIRNFAKMTVPNKHLILGEMYELGDNAEAEHKKIQLLCNEVGLDAYVFYVGNWPKEGLLFKDTASLQEYLQTHPIEKATILIKGSRGVKLESVIDYL